jgi:hypothetical protein
MRMIYFAIFLTLISLIAASFEPLPPVAGSLANIAGCFGIIFLFWGCHLIRREEERREAEIDERIEAFAPPIRKKP